MQSITTKYYGPTSIKGSRIKAETSSGVNLWSSYDDDVSRDENHLRAAKLLKEKLNWNGQMAGGDTRKGMVFVFIGEYTI